MLPNHILGIPILEEAAPGDFVAQQEREVRAQLQAAIDMLRCASCGSLNYETTLFVFTSGVEKMVECRNCGFIHEEMLPENVVGQLGFRPYDAIPQDGPYDDSGP